MFGHAKTLYDRVLPNVLGLELELLMVANAMIEKVFLPPHARSPNLPRFPASNNQSHVAIERKGQECMEMVRHEEEEMAVPCPPPVIKGGGVEQYLGDSRIGERSIRIRPASNANVENRVRLHPCGSLMMQAAG